MMIELSIVQSEKAFQCREKDCHEDGSFRCSKFLELLNLYILLRVDGIAFPAKPQRPKQQRIHNSFIPRPLQHIWMTVMVPLLNQSHSG
jgi:hypothetical protein